MKVLDKFEYLTINYFRYLCQRRWLACNASHMFTAKCISKESELYIMIREAASIILNETFQVFGASVYYIGENV